MTNEFFEWKCPICGDYETISIWAKHLKKRCKKCTDELDRVRKRTYVNKSYSPPKRKKVSGPDPIKLYN